MKKEELVSKGLTEVQAQSVIDIWTEEMKGYIPKTRFDEVNTVKGELESQIADRDKQLKTLKDAAKDSGELQNKIAELETTNKQTKAEYEGRIKDMKLTSAIREQLTDCRYPDLVVDKFDRTKLILGENGKVNNNDSGRSLLRASLVDYFTTLQGMEAIQNFETGDVSILAGTDSDAVVVGCNIQPVDSVEKIYITVNLS